MQRPDALAPARDIAPAKLNLALHVRGKRRDGRHDIETIFAFCADGDRLEGSYDAGDAKEGGLSLSFAGPFGDRIGSEEEENSVELAWQALSDAVRGKLGGWTRLKLTKNLPVASGLGGGSADAAAALRLLTSLWGIDPRFASEVAPKLGSDVPACLLSLPMRGEGAGDELTQIDLSDLAGIPVLIVNPLIPLSTAAVFAKWDGIDRGPLGDWREGRNDLEAPAIALVPQIADVLNWLRDCEGANFVRMSGSGASCFGLFNSEEARDLAAASVPEAWWHLATNLR